MAVLTGREKVNIFLAILGPEISAKILRHLPEEMALLIASGVNKMSPSKEAIGLVLRDFGRLFLAPGGPTPLSLKNPNPEVKKEPSFDELMKNVPPKQVYNFLSRERVQTVAFILNKFSQLPVSQVLSLFSPEIRTKIEVAMEKIHSLTFSERYLAPIQKILNSTLLEVAHGPNQKRIT